MTSRVIPSDRSESLSFRASAAPNVIPSERSPQCHSERAQRVEESPHARQELPMSHGRDRRVVHTARLSEPRYAMRGAANSGADTSAAPPRRRGYADASSGTIGVAAARSVSARSEISLRIVGSS